LQKYKFSINKLCIYIKNTLFTSYPTYFNQVIHNFDSSVGDNHYLGAELCSAEEDNHSDGVDNYSKGVDDYSRRVELGSSGEDDYSIGVDDLKKR